MGRQGGHLWRQGGRAREVLLRDDAVHCLRRLVHLPPRVLLRVLVRQRERRGAQRGQQHRVLPRHLGFRQGGHRREAGAELARMSVLWSVFVWPIWHCSFLPVSSAVVSRRELTGSTSMSASP